MDNFAGHFSPVFFFWYYIVLFPPPFPCYNFPAQSPDLIFYCALNWKQQHAIFKKYFFCQWGWGEGGDGIGGGTKFPCSVLITVNIHSLYSPPFLNTTCYIFLANSLPKPRRKLNQKNIIYKSLFWQTFLLLRGFNPLGKHKNMARARVQIPQGLWIQAGCPVLMFSIWQLLLSRVENWLLVCYSTM